MRILRLLLLSVVSGVLAGVSSFVFMEGLDRITRFRTDHAWLVYLLPLAGLAVGAAYHFVGGRAGEGNSLLIDQIHEPTGWVPRRMAPMVLVGTWITHLFGGSAGREGTALQMSGSLTDHAARIVRLEQRDRPILLVASLAGGFGAVFGVPLAGTVFGLEVPTVGRYRFEALAPALTASVVGHLVMTGLGYDHHVRPQFDPPVDLGFHLRIAAAGLAFAAAGALFAFATHAIKRVVADSVGFAPLRPVVGGVAVVALAALVGSDYLGLSLPLIDRALAGEELSFAVFAIKLALTAITLGCGFPGGEVTPLFVIGSTLGAALAVPLDLPVGLLAAVGFVAVFAAAANTPVACIVMGAELFGVGALAPITIGCAVAFLASGTRGIYPSQRPRGGGVSTSPA